VLVAELVPPPWREVAELFELAGLAAAGQGRGGCRGGSGGRRSVAHRASERERENASRLSPALFFSRVSKSERAKQERSLSPFQKSLFPLPLFLLLSPSNPPDLSPVASHDLRRHAHARLRGHLDGSVSVGDLRRPEKQREEREFAVFKSNSTLFSFTVSSCLLLSSSLHSSNRVSRSRCVAVKAAAVPQVRWRYRMRRITEANRSKFAKKHAWRRRRGRDHRQAPPAFLLPLPLFSTPCADRIAIPPSPFGSVGLSLQAHASKSHEK